MPRKRGRPPLGSAARKERVQVRTTTALRKRVTAAAKRDGLSESEWGEAAFELALERGSTR